MSNLTPRDRDNRLDACQHGLVPCSPRSTGIGCMEGERRRDLNGQAWSALVTAARHDRRMRVAARGTTAQSLSAAAQDAGIVPGYGTTHQQAGCCAAWQQVQRNAATILWYEYRHQVASIWHTTAWAMAR